ncbi:MAG TPA: hypothetical protein VGD31_07125, partial [Sphingobacteriaceae bacterium]
MFVRKELSNASVVYQMLKKWKRPEAVNFFEVLKMQSNKLPVGFNCDKLVKLAFATIINDHQPFKINVSFENILDEIAASLSDTTHRLFPLSATFAPTEIANTNGFHSPFKSLLEFNIAIAKSPERYYLIELLSDVVILLIKMNSSVAHVRADYSSTLKQLSETL